MGLVQKNYFFEKRMNNICARNTTTETINYTNKEYFKRGYVLNTIVNL